VCINVWTEQLITFRTLAKRLPPGRNGRMVAISTIHRWRLHGTRGVRLEAASVGGRWVTSEEAFQRFSDRLGETKNGGASEASPRPVRDNDAIDKSLDAEGL